MGKIVQAVVGAVLRYVGLWLDAKRAERLEVKLKQKESQMRADEVQRKLLEASIEPRSVPTPSMWNKGAKLVILVAVVSSMLTAGCHDYVESAWPYIPEPTRPVLSETQTDWTERESALVEYSLRLEALIEKYNDEAAQHNQKNGYGTPPAWIDRWKGGTP